MKNFLKPTKVTWITVTILSVLMFIPLFLLNRIWPWSTLLEILSIPFLLSYILLFSFFHTLGLPVGKIGQGWVGFPSPNILGWIVIVGVQLVFLYFFASLVSFIWFKIKGKEALPNIPNS